MKMVNPKHLGAPRQQGQGLVEFALIITLLVLILMGIFDVGRAIYYHFVLNNTVHEAARGAITCAHASPYDCSDTDTNAKTRAVNTTVGVPITTDDITISPTTRSFGDTVTVTASVSYVPITPLISRFGVGGGFTINARSQMIAQ